MRLSSLGLVLTLLAPLPAGADWSGKPLAEYLQSLNASGQRVIFTSDLVTDDMLLSSTPEESLSKDSLSDLLRQFGLTLRLGPGDSLLVIRGEPDKPQEPPIAKPAEIPIPEVIVTSSLHRLQNVGDPSHTYLDQELATRIPTTGEEAVRLTARLPGTASGGVSSRNHVRGGEVNEVLFLLDGLRLYEPYHLKDFQAIGTIINSRAVDGMDYYTGAYPARYGDRMSGVLSLELREAQKTLETEIGLSFFNTSILSAGLFGDAGRGDWLFSARRGNLDLVVDVVDPDAGTPDYNDVLAHIGWDFGARARLSANLLAGSDKLALFDNDRGEQASASYRNQILWLKWDADWSDALSSRSILAIGDIDDRRTGTLELPGIVSGTLDEQNDVEHVEFRQEWQWVMREDLMLSAGLNYRSLDAMYRFDATKNVASPFSSILDNQPNVVRSSRLDPSGSQYAVHSELRWRFAERWTADVGLRWDEQNYTTASDDRQYSPRASVLYSSGSGTDIRVGWGQYYQAQEINELQISDGITGFFPAQRAEHFVVNARRSLRSGVGIDLSLYRKSFRTLRPRFENVFNTLTLLPELQFDRVRIDPNNSESVGVEMTLSQGDSEDDRLWWLSYAWSRVEDRLAAGTVRRSWDQTHTFKGGASWRWRQWDFSLAGEVHTGWPRTTLNGQQVAGPSGPELVLSVSDRNGDRYPAFHSLDARISREFDVPSGDLTAYLEITNLYNRANDCCIEYSIDDSGALASRNKHWLPLVPSLGILWRF